MPKRGFEEKRREINEYLERGRLAGDNSKYRNPREPPSEIEEGYMDERENPSSKNSPERSRVEGNLLENIVNSAANTAAEILSKERPRFSKALIAKYLDPKALMEYAKEVAYDLREGKMTQKEADDYLASQIISGKFLNPAGKKFIIESGLEKEAKEVVGKKGAKELLKGERYLDKAMSAFRDVYNLKNQMKIMQIICLNLPRQ